MRLTVGLAVLCLAPGLAQAEPGGPDFAHTGPYLGVGGTYAFHWFPDGVGGDFDDHVSGIPDSTTRTDGSFGVNARAGWRFTSWLAGEVEYEWLDGFETDIRTSAGGEFTLESHAITANAKLVYPGWGRFQPYGLLGAGVSIYEVTNASGFPSAARFLDDDGVGFAGRLGLGLDTYLTEHWLVNIEGGLVTTTTEIDNSNPSPVAGDVSALWQVPIQVGIQYRF
jgi:opacity protein-like surface antigen